METPPIPSRDPVCECIESLLRELEAEGKGVLKTTKGEGVVQVSFGRITASAVNFDIALVRLATAMMDDRRYCRILTEKLQTPMQMPQLN